MEFVIYMWIWILATLVAFYIKGLCGFGNTLIFSTVMTFGVNNIDISPIGLAMAFPTNIILTWTNRKKLKASVYIPLSLLILLGSIPGAFLLKNVNARHIKIVFGIAIIFIGVEMLLRQLNVLQFKSSKILLAIIGYMSGILCGLFGIGSLMAAYVSRVTDTGDEFKANISAVFIVENVFRGFTYFMLGIMSLSAIKQAVLLYPVMLTGLFLGILSSKLLDDRVVKQLVIILLIISGTLMIIKNLL